MKVSPARELSAVLAKALTKDTQPLHMIQGKATATSTGHVTVTINGASVVVPHLAGYTPAVNHIVYILVQGAQMIAIGNVS